MTYIPKSNINISHANKGIFIYRYSKAPFEGYYIETAEGTYFAGNNPLQLDQEIIKITDYTPKTTNTTGITDLVPSFGTYLSNKKYKILKPHIRSKLENYKTITSTKNIPTNEDYTKGWFYRYFVNRINDSFNYEEINFDTFNKIQKATSEYDPNLYRVGSLKWSLKSNNWIPNGKQLELLRKTGFKNIFILFPNLIEFQKRTNHNILNRTYSNGDPIPPSLPPAYGLPKKVNQQCGNCSFNQGGHCNKWMADIRSMYWCKSWYPINFSHNQFSLYGMGGLSFEDFLSNYTATQPIYGCTDQSANNYNPNATTDDGSCFYRDGSTPTLESPTSMTTSPDSDGNLIQDDQRPDPPLNPQDYY